MPRWLDEIPWILFLEWLQYYELEPPWYDDDLRTGQIITILAEINRDTSKRREPFQVEDFMPRLRLFRELNKGEHDQQQGQGGRQSQGGGRGMGLKEWAAAKAASSI